MLCAGGLVERDKAAQGLLRLLVRGAEFMLEGRSMLEAQRFSFGQIPPLFQQGGQLVDDGGHPRASGLAVLGSSSAPGGRASRLPAGRGVEQPAEGVEADGDVRVFLALEPLPHRQRVAVEGFGRFIRLPLLECPAQVFRDRRDGGMIFTRMVLLPRGQRLMEQPFRRRLPYQ